MKYAVLSFRNVGNQSKSSRFGQTVISLHNSVKEGTGWDVYIYSSVAFSF